MTHDLKPSGEPEIVKLTVHPTSSPTVWATRLFNWERHGSNLCLSFAELRLDPNRNAPPQLLIVSRIALPFVEIDSLISQLQEAKAQSQLHAAPTGSDAVN